MRKIAWLTSKNADKKVGIALIKREVSKFTFGYDRNWLVGGAFYKDDGFEVKLRNKPIFEIPVLKRFIRDLGKISKNAQGVSEYVGTEPVFTLAVDIGKTGSGRVNGKIQNVLPESVGLKFTFDTDQSCVRIFWKDLRKFLREIN